MRLPRAVLFDLDDTLYRELDFVESGLRAIARELAARTSLDESAVFAAFAASLEAHGRGRTFDHALATLGLDRPGWVEELVALYRAHEPELALYPDASRALDRLRARGVLLGLVTDGHPGVQRAKARALGLERRLDALRFSWDEGSERQKPDPRAYLGALEPLGVEPADAVYVGDDPAKDFIGARRLGMRSVRVLRGRHAHVPALPGYEADATLDSLDALETALRA
jgi:putative hydrolase of the HAD superfamily